MTISEKQHGVISVGQIVAHAHHRGRWRVMKIKVSGNGPTEVTTMVTVCRVGEEGEGAYEGFFDVPERFVDYDEDLVKRLRLFGGKAGESIAPTTDRLMQEACEEIQRLRAELGRFTSEDSIPDSSYYCPRCEQRIPPSDVRPSAARPFVQRHNCGMIVWACR